nr:hypothetical protein [Acidobacteriota bacterium]
MSSQEIAAPVGKVVTGTEAAEKPRASWLSFDNRFLAPVLITCILLGGQLSFGILESYQKTLLAILTAISIELVLGRLFAGRWPHLA